MGKQVKTQENVRIYNINFERKIKQISLRRGFPRVKSTEVELSVGSFTKAIDSESFGGGFP